VFDPDWRGAVEESAQILRIDGETYIHHRGGLGCKNAPHPSQLIYKGTTAVAVLDRDIDLKVAHAAQVLIWHANHSGCQGTIRAERVAHGGHCFAALQGVVLWPEWKGTDILAGDADKRQVKISVGSYHFVGLVPCAIR